MISKLKTQPYNYIFSCLLIIVFTIIIYIQTLGFGMIEYDDNIYIGGSPHMQEGFTYANFVWSVAFFLNANWAPVTIWSYIADATIYGDWYGGYHLTNVILHGLNGILLFFIALKLSNKYSLSLLLAVLFIVHPQHVESVAWLSQRKDLLSASFMFFSVFLYIVYKTNNKRYCYLLSIGAFVMSLMAKVIVAPLPVVLIVIDYVFFSSKEEKRNFRYLAQMIIEKIPYFIVALAIGGINYYAQFYTGALDNSALIPTDIRVSNIPVAYWFYPIKTLAPFNLIPFYPYPTEAPLLLSVVGLILLFLVTVLLYLFREEYKYLFFGWFCYLLFTTPLSGMFQTGVHAYADRYSYIANIGLLIIVIAVFSRFSEFVSDRAVKSFIIACVLSLTYLSYKQTSLWKDTYTLFNYTLNVSQDNYVAQLKVARELVRDNKNSEAEKYIKRAIESNPLEARVYVFASRHYAIKGNFEEAERLLESALKFNIWQKGLIYREMGQYNLLQGDYEKAIKFATRAIEDEYEIEAAYLVRGIAYRLNGNFNEAISDLQNAISINRQYTKAYIEMGNILIELGLFYKALLYYKEALKQNPSNSKLKKVVTQLTEI